MNVIDGMNDWEIGMRINFHQKIVGDSKDPINRIFTSIQLTIKNIFNSLNEWPKSYRNQKSTFKIKWRHSFRTDLLCFVHASTRSTRWLRPSHRKLFISFLPSHIFGLFDVHWFLPLLFWCVIHCKMNNFQNVPKWTWWSPRIWLPKKKKSNW